MLIVCCISCVSPLWLPYTSAASVSGPDCINAANCISGADYNSGILIVCSVCSISCTSPLCPPFTSAGGDNCSRRVSVSSNIWC